MKLKRLINPISFNKKKRAKKQKLERVVAIDIGTFALKLVEVQLKPKIIVKKLVYYPWQTQFPQKDVTEIICSANFHREIIGILESNNITCKNILILAANNKLVMRPMRFPPNLSDSEIKQLLKLQVEEHIPYKQNEVYYDYSVMRNKDETLTHLYASEKNYINELISIFKGLKRSIKCINVSPVVMYNIANKSRDLQLKELEIIVTVNLGANLTELCVFKKNELLLYRTIPIAGNKFTNAFATDETTVMNKAEYSKCEIGLSKAIQMQSVLAVQNELFDQLWKSIQYVIARNKHYSLKKVYLTGGSANLKGLVDKFRRYIEIKYQEPGETRVFDVEILNPFKTVAVDENININEFNGITSSFASVLGLICGDF